MKKGLKTVVLASALALGLGVVGNGSMAFADSVAFVQPALSNYATFAEYQKALNKVVSDAWMNARDQYELDEIFDQESKVLAEAKAYYVTATQPKEDTNNTNNAENTEIALLVKKIEFAVNNNYSNFANYIEFKKAVSKVVSAKYEQARDQYELDEILDWESEQLALAKAHFIKTVKVSKVKSPLLKMKIAKSLKR